VQARLEELKKEFETGQAELQKLDAQRVSLQETMLRISGAIQVLEELLAGQDGTVPGEGGSAAPTEEPVT
jgi:hypothetical protein